MNEGKLQKRIFDIIMDTHYEKEIKQMLDEVRKDLFDKAKTINDCELFPNCWGKVVRLDDILKWFDSDKKIRK